MHNNRTKISRQKNGNNIYISKIYNLLVKHDIWKLNNALKPLKYDKKCNHETLLVSPRIKFLNISEIIQPI